VEVETTTAAELESPISMPPRDDIPAEVPQQPPPLRAKARAIVPPPRPTVDIRSQLQTQDDQSVRDWIDSLAGESEVKVTITRKRPMIGKNGENIGGALETVEDRIDEEYVRETWGGGEFSLKVMTPQPNGKFTYFKGRTIKIAGPPKMFGQVVGESATPIAMASNEDSLTARAFDTMADNARQAQIRADRIERESRHQPPPPGLDLAALQALQGPMIAQLQAAQHTITNLQQQILALATKPPERDEFRDDIMRKAVEGEGRRIEQLREQYEMRIDKLRDNHEDAIKRLEDRHREEVARIEKRHEREIEMSGKSIDVQLATVKEASGARLDNSKETISRLERELAAAATKIAALEAKKDQSIGEKAEEIMKVQEVIEGLGGGDKDEAWYEKLIGAVGNSEAAVKLINKLSGGTAEGAPQLPPPGVPFQTGDGNVYVRDAAGNTTIVNHNSMREQRGLAAARKRKKAQQHAAAPGSAVKAGLADDDDDDDDTDGGGEQTANENAAPSGRKPTAGEVKAAIAFLENSMKNGTDDAKVAMVSRAAQSLVPGDVLAFIQSVGPDVFFNKAGLDAGSPLTTVRGRQFVRQVFKNLFEGGA